MVTTLAAQNPFASARIAAITQLAVFEAVNACTGRYRPYLGTITAPDGASAEAAAVAAAHARAEALRPGQRRHARSGASGVARGHARRQAEGRRHRRRRPPPRRYRGAPDDGSAPPETWLPTSTDPGIRQPTPPASAPASCCTGATSRRSASAAAPVPLAPPPSLQSRRYTRDYNEVMQYGSDHEPAIGRRIGPTWRATSRWSRRAGVEPGGYSRSAWREAERSRRTSLRLLNYDTDADSKLGCRSLSCPRFARAIRRPMRPPATRRGGSRKFTVRLAAPPAVSVGALNVRTCGVRRATCFTCDVRRAHVLHVPRATCDHVRTRT